MKKLIYKIKLIYRFFVWYKNYTENDKRLTVLFYGYERDSRQFAYDNPHLKVITINSYRDVDGRYFDTLIIGYGNQILKGEYYQILQRSQLSRVTQIKSK